MVRIIISTIVYNDVVARSFPSQIFILPVVHSVMSREIFGQRVQRSTVFVEKPITRCGFLVGTVLLCGFQLLL
jgi:hypothetical protein